MNAPSLRSSHPFLRFFKEPFLKVSFAMALLGLILIIPQTAFAAIYTVKNTSDSGSGSLRDAINQVNAGSGGDTINFSGVTGTITVASTLVSPYWANTAASAWRATRPVSRVSLRPPHSISTRCVSNIWYLVSRYEQRRTLQLPLTEAGPHCHLYKVT